MPSPRLTEEELRLFSQRISRSLAERPQELAFDAHRERIATLLREMGEATHYQFLGIEPTASALEVHEGFERTARLVHPDNALRLGLDGREGALDVLFERATEAYLTLSGPDRRKQYDRELGPRLWTNRKPAPTVSKAEEAARLYERARALAASEQVYSAIELLRQAVRTAPKAEALVLLGTLEARNPHWLRAAEQHLEQALSLSPRTAGVAEALKEVREKRARLAAGQSLEAGTEDSQEVQIL
jgi:curved DNA-binding protein CbpA